MKRGKLWYCFVMLSMFLFMFPMFPGCGEDEKVEPAKPEKSSAQTEENAGNSNQTQQPKYQKAPDFLLPDALNPNREVSLKDFQGKVTLINFWATWCVPCLKEMPELVTLYNKYQSRGFELVALSADDLDTQKDIKPFVEKFKMNFAVLLANGDAVKSYKLVGLPSTYILDKNHNVRFAHVGAQPMEVFEAEVAKLLNE